MPFTPKFVDLVRNFTTVQGTGPVVIGAAVSGYTGLAQALGAGDQFYYCLQSVDKPQEREVGRGTLQADGKVAREPISGPPTNFSSGTKTIALVAAAEWFSRLDGMGGATQAASRAELAAKDPAAGPALLAEPGREGLFVFMASDLSGQVAADPRQAIHIAPAADASGASGAWVRTVAGPVNVKWFGAAGDNATDDSPAFVAGIAYLRSIAVDDRVYYKASPELLVPAGTYFMGTTALDIAHTFRMRGEASNGLQGNSSATVLRWADGTDGIRVQGFNTSGIANVIEPGQNAGAGFSLEDIRLIGGYSGSEGEFHAFRPKAMFNLRNVVIQNWSGDGIHAHNDTGGAGEGRGNTNTSAIDQVCIMYCRDGLSRKGGDANAWTMRGLDVTLNRRWGKNIDDFLGGTEIGGHAADNGLVVGAVPTVVSHNGNRYAVRDAQEVGASTNAPSGTTADNAWWYYLQAGGPSAGNNIPAWSAGINVRAGGAARYANPNAQNLLLGTYTEGGQGPIQGVVPTLIFGGSHGYVPRGGAPLVKAVLGGFGSAGKLLGFQQSTGHYTAISEDGGLEYFDAANGSFTQEWFNGDLAWTAFRSGSPSAWAFKITGEATASALGSRRMDFPNGYGLAGKKVLSGTAAPASGAFVQGDMMFNSAPAAGGAMGWMCVAAGTPGTWKAMASLAA